MTFRDQAECYRAIGEALAAAAPTGWRQIDAAIALDGARVDAVVSCLEPSGQVKHLTGIPRLASHFYDLVRLVSTEEKGFCKTCTFRLLPDGNYDSQLTY